MNLSFFQYLTLMALLYFSDCSVDVIILECGLGGRLDDTNIVCSDASVITSVSFDHEEILGNTIEDIAREKAGIIEPGRKVFIGELSAGAEAAVAKVAQDMGAQLVKVEAEGRCFASSLEGDFQKKNAKLAQTVLEDLREILPISDDAISRGFAGTFWPARNQTIFLKNRNRMILDGAHNGEAVEAQVDYIRHTVNKDSTILIFSSTKARHCEACFATLEPLFHKIFLTNVADGNKKIPDDFFSKLAERYSPKCCFVTAKSLVEILAQPTDETYFLTGSLLLIGELSTLFVENGLFDRKYFGQFA
jgi:dihydrofolate synthase/folylpolyglutamate synthase